MNINFSNKQSIYLLLIASLVLLQPFTSLAQKQDFGTQLKTNKTLKSILKKRKKYKVQILFSTFADSTKSSLITQSYGLDDGAYFYPASTIKLPMAILGLEKINELGLKGDEAVQYISSHSDYPSLLEDKSSKDGKAHLTHFIKKIFLASDNDAFNRLYDFVGKDYFNQRMADLGYPNTWVNHRLSIALSEEAQRAYPVVSFENGFQIQNRDNFIDEKRAPILLGKAYIKDGKKIKKPMDFGMKNQFSLSDQHRLVQMLLFPNLFPEDQRFHITDDQLQFIKEYMGMYLSESKDPVYAQDWDAMVKFLVFGAQKGKLDTTMRIYNKIGGAYGFLIDNAYIIDPSNGIECFLSAIIYVNKNQTFNDDTYEYDEIGYPFLGELGRVCVGMDGEK